MAVNPGEYRRVYITKTWCENIVSVNNILPGIIVSLINQRLCSNISVHYYILMFIIQPVTLHIAFK